MFYCIGEKLQNIGCMLVLVVKIMTKKCFYANLIFPNNSSVQWVIGNSSCRRINCWTSSLHVLAVEVHLLPTFNTGEVLSFPSNRNVDFVVFVELGPAGLLLVLFLPATLNSRVPFCFLGFLGLCCPSPSLRCNSWMWPPSLTGPFCTISSITCIPPLSVWKGQQSLYF